MLWHVLAAVASIAIWMVGFTLGPSRASCPPRWNLHEGVRRDGSFACYGPLEPGCGEPVGPSKPCPHVPIVRGRIYCTGGQVPIIDDGWRVVGCQARH